MEQKRIRRKRGAAVRVISFVLSAVLAGMGFIPYFPFVSARAASGDTVVLSSAFGDFGGDHKLYCIDKGGYAYWGIADDGDVYQKHRPSELSLAMTKREQEYVFWGLLTLQASLGVRHAVDAVARIRTAAQAEGKMPITNLVTEEDLKALIYSEEIRGKYAWLETVASSTEEYLRMAGLVSGGVSGNESTGLPSGRKVPSVLAGSTSVTEAYSVDASTCTITFDETGADAEFIRQVPLLFSNDNGIVFQPEPTDGWMYEKTETQIRFYHPDPNPPKALIRFAAEGTEFASAGGYASAEELFEECLEIWECIQCSGKHRGGTPPTSETWHHQRMVWMEFQPANVGYYAALGGRAATGADSGNLQFQVFRHEEEMRSHYNLQLYKYDYETGKPLKGARFALYERFDDAGETEESRDGAEHLYLGGAPYAGGYTDAVPVWDGFRKAAAIVTGADGRGEQTVEHGYHYDKTFCNGHPAPVFVSVPEEEEDEETGEVLNEGEIEAAKAENRRLARAWLLCSSDCEEKGSGDWQGVHFHWVLDGVDQGEIESLADSGGSEGETPEAGEVNGAEGETAFLLSGCREDRDATYEKFISMKYSYAWQEYQAGDGYIRHDLHPDDLPIEIITTDSSEHGANASFSGEYSRDALDSSGRMRMVRKEEPEAEIRLKELPLLRAAGPEKHLLREYVFIDEGGDEEETEEEEKEEQKEAQKEEQTEEPERAAASEAGSMLKKASLSEAGSIAEKATASEAGSIVKKASSSEAESTAESAAESAEKTAAKKATSSEAEFSLSWQGAALRFSMPERSTGEENTSSLFLPAYEEALLSAGTGEPVEPGPDHHYSHCNNKDGENDAWRIYDHRTEGEYYVNKKDLDLASGESEEYSAYGDTQGDASLEGAVYGLFAAEDIIHPDGSTGVVYRKGDLVSTAATDQNGDFSFLVNTRAPGYTYDYETGSVKERAGGWAQKAPVNLYDRTQTMDDYTEDGKYSRSYLSHREMNGNCWIGRPLILGEYFIKELSRSEGYELSVGNKNQDLTNFGQELMPEEEERTGGSVRMIENLRAEEQTGAEGGAGPNELFFSAGSHDTKEPGYQLKIYGLPEGVQFYRKDTGTVTKIHEAGSGIWEKVYLTNEDGTPKLLRAVHSYQYPRYNADGSLMTEEKEAEYSAEHVMQAEPVPLSGEIIEEVLLQAEFSMTEEENLDLLEKEFEEEDFSYVKMKLEKILRRHKKSVPSRLADGKRIYSGPEELIFDDTAPIRRMEAEVSAGTSLTTEDVLLSLLSYYDSHPYYSFGGLHSVETEGDRLFFTMYASFSGTPELAMVRGEEPEKNSLFFRRHGPGPESGEAGRYCYAVYSNEEAEGEDCFGTYRNYEEAVSGGVSAASAVLCPAAVLSEDGSLTPELIRENVYYEAGELVRGPDGSYLQAFEYREKTVSVREETEEVFWKLCPAVRCKDGTYRIAVNPEYIDSFGTLHTDEGEEQRMEFKAVLEETEKCLTGEEAELLGAGYFDGHRMNSAGYYVYVKKARALALLSSAEEGEDSDSSYLLSVPLLYPGQNLVCQENGSRETPGQVYERVIRQPVELKKTLEEKQVSEKMIGKALPGFRYKLYLRSNLQRLYRKENGEIVWLNREGKETPPKALCRPFFKNRSYADVPKLYTEVLHREDSVTTGSVSNNVWEEAVLANRTLYSADADGLIRTEPNPGYTGLLEVSADGSWNYEKFFEAIAIANFEIWDMKKAESTSWKPFPAITESSEEAKKNAVPSDAVRQFAIRWYLKEEIKKLSVRPDAELENEKGLTGKAQRTQEQRYEVGLERAVQKAENYLKPFFLYDLDEICAISWDSAENGGADGDTRTLSADQISEDGSHASAVSKYLPYGIYVAVELQPLEENSGEYYHRHYQIGLPREITIPSVTDRENYLYQSQETPEQLAGRYHIRMNEEWAETNEADLRTYVIRGHSHKGDFEVFPYGLAAGKRKGQISSDGGTYTYRGFELYQKEYKPYKEDTGVSVSEQRHRIAGIPAITGALTGQEGEYFAALSPWTQPFAVLSSWENLAYGAKLRIEKLDSDTGEAILHDGAVFAVYRAERDTSKNGNGRVKFYEKDTMIIGSREFLQAMGAREITPAARGALPWEMPYHGPYYGTVPAGTPVCYEKNQVVFQDSSGNRTGYFHALSSTRDGLMEDDCTTANQNTGYLLTPEPLAADVYVLCEIKAPAGYVPGPPAAVELYSDQIAYYLDGRKDRRVRAAVYEEHSRIPLAAEDGTEERRDEDTARIYYQNTPIQLEITKRKPKEKEGLYYLNGRLEGSRIQLAVRYGLENLELAYNDSGTYLGYGWRKGLIEQLNRRREKGEQIELLYEDNVFCGTALLKREVEASREENPYLPGAVLTLYDAIELQPSGDREDYRYLGVQVVRDSFGNVENIYMQKGYAGNRICYVKNKTDPEENGWEDEKHYRLTDEEDDTGEGHWIAKTVEREDTDLLFFDLGGLLLCGETGIPGVIYAKKDGKPFLEIFCPLMEDLKYNGKEKVFDSVPEGTRMYHLDENGRRDSLVDPYTGLAYAEDEQNGKRFAWPVTTAFDSYGNVISREKIKTWRPASVRAGTPQEYTIGSLLGGKFEPFLSPVCDSHGLPLYYRRSEEVYRKGRPVYDRDGDYVRYKYDDKLDAFNRNAWEILPELQKKEIGADVKQPEDDVLLYHRLGESWIIENTWISGEKEPDNPFTHERTEGQPDLLKRVPAGTYILEELSVPAGYVKGMPQALTVTAEKKVQKLEVINQPIRVLFEKIDAPSDWLLPAEDYDGAGEHASLFPAVSDSRLEGKGSYSYEPVEGTILTLRPAVFGETEGTAAETGVYQWTVGKEPEYLEGIPAGRYLLEEIRTMPGYIPASMEVEIRETEDLQSFCLPNDHSKLEVLKYISEEEGKRLASASDGAVLALYPAMKDENGEVMYRADGSPCYEEESCLDTWTVGSGAVYLGENSFTGRYEALFEEYGADFAVVSFKEQSLSEAERTAFRVKSEVKENGAYVKQLWETEAGKRIDVSVWKGQRQDGSFGWNYEYRFHYKALDSEESPSAVSYDTVNGVHRFDYLDCSFGAAYVLAEKKAAAGCKKALPRLLVPQETEKVQLYAVENTPGYLEIIKVTEEEAPLAGAVLALYRPAADGSFSGKPEDLVEQWTTGSDGSYTEEDARLGRIPDGLKPGDIKAHRITPLEDGIYYLAELEAPEGFLTMAPKKLVAGEDMPVCQKAENLQKKGYLEICKRSSEDETALAGAVFLLKNLDTGDEWKIATGTDGIGRSPLLKTGDLKKGVWTPYQFALQEISPPPLHAVNDRIWTFRFQDTGEPVLCYQKTAENRPTRILIGKRDAGGGYLLKGAVLAVYQAKAEEGIYRPEGTALERWVSDGTAHEIIGKLSAGESYLLVEEKAPDGYSPKEPILFTLSKDGTGIAGFSADCREISFEASELFTQQIESVSIWGRKALGTRRCLTDLESGNKIEVPTGSMVELTKQDGLKDGSLYEETEETIFSDGSSKVTERSIFLMELGESGGYIPRWRVPEQTVLKVQEEAGRLIEEWETEAGTEGYLHRIRNPEYQEERGIFAVGRNGKNGEAVRPGTILHYEAVCVNTGTAEKDLRVSVKTDPQTEWMPANSDVRWKQNGDLLTAVIAGVKPGEKKSLLLTVAVKPEAEGLISCRAVMDGAEYTQVHPTAAAGSVCLIPLVTGTGAGTAEAEFSYQMTFMNAQKEVLKGLVSFYRLPDTTEHRMRSGETVTLKKGEILSFAGLPYGTICLAAETEESRQRSELYYHNCSESQVQAETGKEPASLLFAYEKRDGSARDVFKKGENYCLEETVRYSDGTVLTTDCRFFGLDGDGHVSRMDMSNEKIDILIRKTDSETDLLLPGAELELRKAEKDAGGMKAGALVERWTSTGEPHLLGPAASPGELLLLRETAPPSGYGYAKEMFFAVPEEGGILTLQMKDRPVQVMFRKTALSWDGSKNLGPLAGAVIRIEDEEGTEVHRFTTGAEEYYRLPPVLKAGCSYRAVEERAPAGYHKSEPVTFTIPKEGGCIEVVVYDRRIRGSGGSGGEDKPKKPETEGKITVHRNQVLYGRGEIFLPGQKLTPLPLTGDSSDWMETEAAVNAAVKAAAKEKIPEQIILLIGLWAGIAGFLFLCCLRKEKR